jgi:hypothetical protein
LFVTRRWCGEWKSECRGRTAGALAFGLLKAKFPTQPSTACERNWPPEAKPGGHRHQNVFSGYWRAAIECDVLSATNFSTLQLASS